MTSLLRLAAGLALAAMPSLAGGQDTLTRRPSSRTITLQDAIALALAQNSTILFARNAAALDSLNVRQARNAFLPNLSASTSTSQGFGTGSQGENSLAVGAGLSSGITLFNGGQNTNTLRQARLNLQASGEELARSRQTVVFVVATDFLALITQQQQLGVQQENLAAQEQELQQLEQFVRAGTRPIGDQYQQQAAVAATRLALVNARRAAEVAELDLIRELLLDPRQDYTFVTPTTVGEGAAPRFDLDSLITVALSQRVDIRAQMLRVQAAERETRIAEGGRLPLVTGSAGYSAGFNSANDGGFATQLNQRRGGSIGVGVSVPIFDRGAVSIARQRAQIQLENEQILLRDQSQEVALEVRRAYLDYVAAGEQLAAADAQQRAAALALQAAQSRYRVGLATFVEVTLARASLVQAQSAVVSARSSLVFQQALMSYYTGVLDPSRVTL
jgi:outer membrane protein